jgi:Flp pilus assembly protein CpaB
VVVALLLASAATAGVFLYTQGVKKDARGGGVVTTVLVATVNIPANTDLSTIVQQNKLKAVDVPTDILPEGVVTDVAQLEGRRNIMPILANEPIPLARIQAGEVSLIGVPKDHEAITVPLEGPRAGGQALVAGDNVSVFATFRGVDPRQVKGLKMGPTVTTGASQGADVTVLLVGNAEVLDVHRPFQTSGVSGDVQETVDPVGVVAVSLALMPEEAQKFVFSMEQGTVWLGLLPPGAGDESKMKPISYGQVVA